MLAGGASNAKPQDYHHVGLAVKLLVLISVWMHCRYALSLGFIIFITVAYAMVGSDRAHLLDCPLITQVCD